LRSALRKEEAVLPSASEEQRNRVICVADEGRDDPRRANTQGAAR
jgi:hypothetical protein